MPGNVCNGACENCCPLSEPSFECNHSCLKHCPHLRKKIFNDPIHGTMDIHHACVAIIDTPQFQRLRYIKQLGMCYFVYPGASHHRFEHSIGVCYLAGKFVRILRRNQPELHITEKDILCVEIAGLCHDLGHGPFSHLFDQHFVPRAKALEDSDKNDKADKSDESNNGKKTTRGDKEKATENPKDEWKHEKASIDMLDYLIKENKFMEPDGILRKYGLEDKDIIFIKELIYGPLKFEGKLEGRDERKQFLYEIVSNKRNGIDVDKWDYLARDCLYLGIKNNFDHNRFMGFARVVKAKGSKDKDEVLQICIRDKEIGNLYNMFHARFTIHKIACQHRVNLTIENMVATALVKANAELKFKGTGGQERTMLECINDMEAFSKLTDNVLHQILNSEIDSKDMKEAQDIIKRILSRDLDKFVCESGFLDHIEDTKDEGDRIIEEIKQQYDRKKGPYDLPFQKDDVIIQLFNFDFGMRKRNPLKNLLVYYRDDNQKAFPLPEDMVSRIVGPTVYSETCIRVTSRKRPNEVLKEAAKNVLEKRKRHN